MFTPASAIKKTITRAEIIEYFEEYLREIINKAAAEGNIETCISGYNISVNKETGEKIRGLHNRTDVRDFCWQWINLRDMTEIYDDLRKAGYKVYDKNNNGCIWVAW